ncbi:MAG: valine--tRNA ligase [bacterium]
MAEIIPSKYDPKAVEEKWYSRWLIEGLFHADAHSKKEPFTILIPPPNITGELHIGHALNNSIQDFLIRRARMLGYETLWIPGIDHAGIATENKVEQYLASMGIFREKITRERFLKSAWEWKDKYGGIIIKQLKRLGCSCDWDRLAFTLDKKRQISVNTAFMEYYKQGLIYRGKYIVNWCPRCKTVISDLEVEHIEKDSKLYYIAYPLLDEKGSKTKESVVVATTRPETMLGDMAVAINPEDDRYKNFIGRYLELPLVRRKIPVIDDEAVDKEFGTGAVKVTPAHDPNDYEISQRHKLEPIIVMDEGAVINENGGRYKGLTREEARKKIIDDLTDENLLIKTEDYHHSVGTCYRCHTEIEPYLSTQWFLRMGQLVRPAIEVIKQGKVRFIPERWTPICLSWLENAKDWCISRQLWWGHRIPIWYCEECDETIASVEEPELCTKCKGKKLHQDDDVLDTWFSSALWPISTMGWPQQGDDFKKFYPTDILVTDAGIIYLWVARMIISGLRFVSEVPFHTVYITTTVQNEEGRRMSKSLGTGIDPMDFIESIGADAVRFTIATISTHIQSIRFSSDRFEIGRNFTNKIWNAGRFILMNTDENISEIDDFRPKLNEDKWIVNCLNRLIEDVNKGYEEFRFNDIAGRLYEFFWHDYCDWYLEIIKRRLYNPSSEYERLSAQRCLLFVMDRWLKLMHPIMPHITEEIYSLLPHTSDYLTKSSWPVKIDIGDTTEAVNEIDALIEIVRTIRNLRSELDVSPSKKVDVLIIPNDENNESIIIKHIDHIKTLASVGRIDVNMSKMAPSKCVSAVVSGASIYMFLEGIVDIDKELKRLNRALENLDEEEKGLLSKLENENFMTKAPSDVIDTVVRRLNEVRAKKLKITDNIKQLKGKI